jgi:hypothetical protein
MLLLLTSFHASSHARLVRRKLGTLDRATVEVDVGVLHVAKVWVSAVMIEAIVDG